MGMERETANAIKNCDTRNCKSTEKEGMTAVQISKDRKLNGRSYRGWLKSLVKQKGSGLVKFTFFHVYTLQQELIVIKKLS